MVNYHGHFIEVVVTDRLNGVKSV